MATMESYDICILCDSAPCECAPKKKAKPKPKRAKSSPPTGATQQKVQLKKSAPRVKPEQKAKTSARPERDGHNLISTEKRDRTKDSELFWEAMKNLVNEGMVHEISVKRALQVYPSVPEGIKPYGENT